MFFAHAFGRAHQRSSSFKLEPTYKSTAFTLSLASQLYLISSYAVHKWPSMLALFELPNMENVSCANGLARLLRVSDRRSNWRIPFVLLQRTSTAGTTYMLLVRPAAAKFHLGLTRTVQHVLVSTINVPGPVSASRTFSSLTT